MRCSRSQSISPGEDLSPCNCSTCLQCGSRQLVDLAKLRDPPSVLWETPNRTEALGGILVSGSQTRQLNRTLHTKRATDEDDLAQCPHPNHYLYIFKANDTLSKLAWTRCDAGAMWTIDLLLPQFLIRGFINEWGREDDQLKIAQAQLDHNTTAASQLDQILKDPSNKVRVDYQVEQLVRVLLTVFAMGANCSSENCSPFPWGRHGKHGKS